MRALGLLLGLWLASGALSAGQGQLVLLNWADYLHPELVSEFEKKYRVEIIEVYYSSDLDRTRILAQSDGAGFDLILSSGSDIRMYVQRGWLAPLNLERLPTAEGVEPLWRNAFFGSQNYALPYLWGTTGIAYRTDLVSEPITRWMQLFRPAAELQGKILLTDDVGELISMGLKALGFSMNTQESEQVQAVEQLLLEQKPHVLGYSYVSFDEDSALLTGKALAAFVYNGDALILQEKNPAIRYVVPEEGTNLWVDYLTLGAKGKNRALAYAFLNFMNEPQNAAKNALYLYSASPHRGAQALLPDEFLQDPLIYPPPATLEHSEFTRAKSPRMVRRHNRIETELMREEVP